MCELFGLSSKRPKKVNEYLRKFYGHCEEHPHGWGLVILDKDNYRLYKEPKKARESVKLGNLISKPIVGKNIFAHIRLATIGKMDETNCHPFVKKDNANRTWTLVHNGTIFDYPPLCSYVMNEKGETDSERILLYIIDKVNVFEEENHKISTLKERFDIIDNLIRDMAFGNKLNLMIFDGEQMYVHTNCKDTLHYSKNEDSIIFSTQSLDENKHWKHFPLNTVCSFKDGKIKFIGRSHKDEYIETEEQLKFIEKFIESLNNNSGGEYVW